MVCLALRHSRGREARKTTTVRHLPPHRALIGIDRALIGIDHYGKWLIGLACRDQEVNFVGLSTGFGL